MFLLSTGTTERTRAEITEIQFPIFFHVSHMSSFSVCFLLRPICLSFHQVFLLKASLLVLVSILERSPLPVVCPRSQHAPTQKCSGGFVVFMCMIHFRVAAGGSDWCGVR